MIFTSAIAATVLIYTWLLAPITPRWTATAAAAVVISIALARAAKTREWGFAPSEFLPAVGAAALFTAGAAAAVAIAGWQLRTWHVRPSFWRDTWALIPWALGQQFVLQTVLLREAQAVTARRAGVIVASALFAALHLPNPFLTTATLVAGLGWCWIYDRHPNLLPVALSHTVLTLVVLCALDDATTGRLRVGAAYLGR